MSVPLAPCERINHHLIMFLNINSCNELKSFKIRSCYLKHFNFRQRVTRKKKNSAKNCNVFFHVRSTSYFAKMFLNKRWNGAKIQPSFKMKINDLSCKNAAGKKYGGVL